MRKEGLAHDVTSTEFENLGGRDEEKGLLGTWTQWALVLGQAGPGPFFKPPAPTIKNRKFVSYVGQSSH